MYSLFQTYTRLGLIREIICIILLVNRLNFSLISKPHLKQKELFILDHSMDDFVSRLRES